MTVKSNRIISLTLLGLFLIGISPGCRRTRPKPAAAPRLIIIGVDGAGWNFMNPLLEEGKLPNFARLMKEGSSGVLQTINPTKSSVIWTSIATGKSMVKHGIVGWTYVKKNKIEVPFTQTNRRVKAFWNIFSEFGWKVGVINWFVTFPPEEVNGYMVSPAFATRRKKNDAVATPITYPAELLKDLSFVYDEEFETILKKENLPDFSKGTRRGSMASHFPRFLVGDRNVESASLFLLKNRPVEVFATYFRLVDEVSHFAVSHVDPKVLAKSKAEAEKGGISEATRDEVDRAYSHILEPIYAYMDRIVGRILESADEKTTIIVVSDHTFILGKGGMGYDHYNMPTLPHGIIIVKGPDIKPGHKIENAHVYDVLPTILHLLGKPAAEDMDGKVIVEAFQDDFMRSHPVQTVPTYEGGAKRKIAPGNKEIDKKTLEDLRSLGYIK